MKERATHLHWSFGPSSYYPFVINKIARKNRNLIWFSVIPLTFSTPDHPTIIQMFSPGSELDEPNN